MKRILLFLSFCLMAWGCGGGTPAVPMDRGPSRDIASSDLDVSKSDPGHEAGKDPGFGPDVSDAPDDAPFDEDLGAMELPPPPTDTVSEGDIEVESFDDALQVDQGGTADDGALGPEDLAEMLDIEATTELPDEAETDMSPQDVVADYETDESVDDSTDIPNDSTETPEDAASEATDSGDASAACVPVPYELVCSDKTTTDIQWGNMADVNWALTSEERLDILKYGSLEAGAGWGSCMSLEWSTIAADVDHVYVSVADQLGPPGCLCGSQLDGLERCPDGTLRFEITVGECDFPCVAGGNDAIFSWTYIVRIPVAAYSPELKPVFWSHTEELPADEYCLQSGWAWWPMGLCMGTDDPDTY